MTRHITRTVGGLAIASGLVGAAAPRDMASLFGLRDASPDAALLMRLYGLGNAALGFNMATADDTEARKLLAVAAVIDGLSAVAAFAAPVSSRTKALLMVTFVPVATVAGNAWFRSRAAAS